jgi:hypothetical protein
MEIYSCKDAINMPWSRPEAFNIFLKFISLFLQKTFREIFRLVRKRTLVIYLPIDWILKNPKACR